jgi:hypothetical protein
VSALDRLEELERSASPGPWRRYADGSTVPGYDVLPGLVSDKWTDLTAHNNPPREDDLDLIAALRNAAPALLRIVRAAERYADSDDEGAADASDELLDAVEAWREGTA